MVRFQLFAKKKTSFEGRATSRYGQSYRVSFINFLENKLARFNASHFLDCTSTVLDTTLDDLYFVGLYLLVHAGTVQTKYCTCSSIIDCSRLQRTRATVCENASRLVRSSTSSIKIKTLHNTSTGGTSTPCTTTCTSCSTTCTLVVLVVFD